MPFIVLVDVADFCSGTGGGRFLQNAELGFIESRGDDGCFSGGVGEVCRVLSGTKIASRNRSDHSGRKRARNHSAAEIAGFFASPAAKESLAASEFCGWPQNRRKLAATVAAKSLPAAARFCSRSDHGTLR